MDKAELEGIVLCKNRNCIFATMDKVAIKFARSNNVFVFDLHTILKSLWKSNILSKSEVKELLTKMELEDRTTIPDKQRIFEP
ncbi:MAG: hypothetical protein ACE5KT_02300 [Methanosarcinales archaeon]